MAETSGVLALAVRAYLDGGALTGMRELVMVTEGPGYWMAETSGALALAVRAYLDGGALTPIEIAVLRSYFEQWIAAPGFTGPEVARLRASAPQLNSRRAVAEWVRQAAEAGIDPL